MEDNRVDVPIELTDEDWYNLMKIAHERDITLNQLVEQILTLEINRLEKEQS
jgi:predicted DNA-binding ribbon-helix-helix protein